MRIATFVIASMFLGGVAHADQESTRLFEEGKELSIQGKYQEACDRFAQSYELEPATGTQVNMGDCEEHLGHIARAWQLFDDAANRSDREGNGVRAAYARRRADVLLPRLGAITLTIDRANENMQVVVAGRAYMPGPEVRAYVEPGEIEIRVLSPGRQFKKTVRVGAGESAAVTAELTATPVPSGVTVSWDGERQREWVVAAGVTAGVGVVALGASVVISLLAARGYDDAFEDGECMGSRDYPQCTDAGVSRLNDARSVVRAAGYVGIGGLSAMVAGAAIYWFAPKSRLEVMPMVTPGGGSVGVGGRF